MRRRLRLRATLRLAAAGVLAALGIGLIPTAAAARTLTAADWDLSAQRLVMREGLMGTSGEGRFEGARAMTAAAARLSLSALAARLGFAPIPLHSNARISVVRFDALLVAQLGLGEVAKHVQQTAESASLAPPPYFGTEVLARYMNLRYEHPTGSQALDLYPWSTITRAEAAYSLALVLRDAGWIASAASEQFSSFTLPRYSPSQLAPLRIAVSKIGMPYVWGGTTDNTADGLEHGGYDCSGFAWRVYKLSGLSSGTQILGRTAAEQAGEIPKAQRVRLDDVAPGDLLFFGSAHFEAKATNANVIHEGIALSKEWAINSAGQGVYVLPLTSGWLRESFTWARRVL